jgi:hypothetical protein
VIVHVAEEKESGPWPGAADHDPGADFVRYLYLARPRTGSRRTSSTRCTRHLKRGDEHAIGNQFGGLLS